MRYVVLGVVCLFCPLSLYAQADACESAATSAVFLPTTLTLYEVPAERNAYFGPIVVQDTVPSLPPLKPGRLLGQYAMGVAIGTLSGLGFGLGLGLAGLAACDGDLDDHDDDELTCAAVGLALGVYGGLIVGSAVGVQAAGNTQTQPAPFLITLGGSALGFLAFVAFNDDDGFDDGNQSDVETLVNLSFPTLGALIAFNTSRRTPRRARSARRALLNRDQGAWSLTVPPVTRGPDPLTLGETPAYHVRLLQVGF